MTLCKQCGRISCLHLDAEKRASARSAPAKEIDSAPSAPQDYVIVQWGRSVGVIVRGASGPNDALARAQSWLNGASGYVLRLEELSEESAPTTQVKRSNAASLPPAGKCFALASEIAREPWERK